MCTIPTFKSGLPHVGRDDDSGGDDIYIMMQFCL